MKKVLIAGTFDFIHPGHLSLIKQAKSLGDFLVVIVARDKNVFKTKGIFPYFKEEERVKNLSQINLVDKVILGDLNDPYKIIKEEKPQIVALGYDQQAHLNNLNDLRLNSDLSFKIERLEPFKETICKGRNFRRAVEDKQANFLLINKEADWTSHDVVAKLRSITGLKQIGHTGTLDPLATGLLICALGKATKLAGAFDILAKVYQATIRLGATSDTYDRQGKIQPQKSKVNITKDQLEDILQGFLGKQKQIPPMYSAKKVNGKKLYELARKNKEIEREPCEIEIYEIKLLDFNSEQQEFNIQVKCSTGTYIRTLAHDIGQKTGTGAILEELKRTAIGDFNIEDAVKLNQLNQENWHQFLIKPLLAIDLLNKT